MKPMNRFLLWILPKNVIAITLYPFAMYYKGKWGTIPMTIINHEDIHWHQQKEMLVIFFYLWYVIEWLIKLPKYGKWAYYAISFEREAYWNEDEDYDRKYFAWFKYIRQ